MRVAIVLNTSWNIYNFRFNLVKTLLQEGHEVHAIAPRDEFSDLLIETGCFFHRLKMDSRGANPIKDFALIFELYSIYKSIKPDIILHYTIKPNVYGTLAAAILKIPTINNVCGLGTVFLKDGIVSRVAKFLYRISFRFASKIFFQNPDDQKLFVEEGLVKHQSVDLLPGSGINLHCFKPTSFKRNEVFTFLLISRLITDKGILEYIEAVRMLKEQGVKAKFQILGAIDEDHKRGIPRKNIDQWVTEGLVDYLGTTNDVRPFIYQSDCVVLPSYREGTPRTLLEAASCSKPIIATNVPGCNQVIENHFNGLLCEMKNVEDLAQKMETMASMDDTMLKKLGANGRIKMEKQFDESIVINKYLAAINNLFHPQHAGY
ncbi:MAG: glycosyltransferase family 4 protein [Flammeovirgaceae bacterium]|nr:glycosyltransferase family 4 protein [Flammeovirgaceae bacterium]